MKFSLATAFTAIVGLVAAAPSPQGYRPGTSNPSTYNPWGTTCLSDKSAKSLVDGFASLLTNYSNATANTLLASDFTDTSDSINVLAGYPLGSTTFPSKAAFMAGQGSQPPIGFTVLNIDVVNCTNVAFRWIGVPNLGQPSIKVKGINSFVASNTAGTESGWQIKTMYSEFNSCTWITAFGGKCGFS